MIFMYYLEDNLLMKFKNSKECAEYFGISVRNVDRALFRLRNEVCQKKRDRKHQRWVKLVEVYDD